jgi:Ankyrin repeats (3 copies)
MQQLLYTLPGFNRAGKFLYAGLILLAGPALAWWFIWRPSSQFHDEDEQLFRAARNGDVAGIARALDAGARVNAAAPIDGKTAIFRAAVFGHADAVRDLLQRGADTNAQGNDGKTVLEIVTSVRSEEHDPVRAKALDAVASALEGAGR